MGYMEYIRDIFEIKYYQKNVSLNINDNVHCFHAFMNLNRNYCF